MATTAAAPSPAPAPSWTAALNVLPAKERLEWVKTINADVEAQARAPPQGPFSRAYASAVHGAAARSSLLERSTVGGHLSAVTRTFPSSDALVARALQEAIDKVGAKPAVPFGGGGGDGADAVGGGGGGAATPSAAVAALVAGEDGRPPSDPGILAAVAAAQLGAAYRPVVAKYLQRRLAADAAWAAERAAAAAAGGDAAAGALRFPHAAAVARGELATSAAHAWEAAREERHAIIDSLVATGEGGGSGDGDARAAAAPAAAAPPPAAAAAPAAGAAASDDLLDAALDELLG
jgi:hypothetical protein